MKIICKMVLLVLIFNSCSNAQDTFDLYTLDFSENIKNVVENNNMDLEDGKSEALTLFGYDRFQTNNVAFLKFNTFSLKGNNKNKDNHVIIHYNEKDKIISLYELYIYTEKEANKIVEVLNKSIGKPSHNSENNNIKRTVWKDEKSKKIYFMLSYLDKKDNTKINELTVLDMNNKRTDEWIEFRDFSYFLN